MNTNATHLLAAPILLVTAGAGLCGDKLPKGPPWHVTYRAAKREALQQGRPVFVYFTKTV